MDRLIRRLAAKSKMAPEKAADGVDKLLHKILTQVRRGETAEIPGLGKFALGEKIQFSTEAQKKEPRGD